MEPDEKKEESPAEKDTNEPRGTTTEADSKSVETGWNINKTDETNMSIADQVKEVAQSALQQSGMVYVESAGMYYDYKTGYYYNSVSIVHIIVFK